MVFRDQLEPARLHRFVQQIFPFRRCARGSNHSLYGGQNFSSSKLRVCEGVKLLKLYDIKTMFAYKIRASSARMEKMLRSALD